MRRLRTSTTMLALAGIFTWASCTDAPTQPHGLSPARSTLPRSLTPGEQAIIGASNAFSFALFNTVSAAQPASNVFLSPLSASMSLGMALNGAADSTYDQMRSALQFGNATQHDIDASYQSLITLLTSLDPSVQLQVANSIWYERTFPFHQSFLDTTHTYFDATVQPLDFSNATGSLSAINGWVNTQTHGKIPSILESIAPGDVMYLLNAVYFKGSWRQRFDSASTELGAFTPAVGAPQQVSLMHRVDTMSYAEGTTYQAVDLAYGDSAFTMTLLLPKPGTSVDVLVDSLTPPFWTTLTSSLHNQYVDLTMPRLRLSYTRQLNGDLAALGMRSAFVPGGADFTRMSSEGRELYMSVVKQDAFVNVDESGTEAAAVTVTGMRPTSIDVSVPVLMHVDRPYLFVIRERLSGTLLFMGKIVATPAG